MAELPALKEAFREEYSAYPSVPQTDSNNAMTTVSNTTTNNFHQYSEEDDLFSSQPDILNDPLYASLPGNIYHDPLTDISYSHLPGNIYHDHSTDFTTDPSYSHLPENIFHDHLTDISSDPFNTVCSSSFDSFDSGMGCSGMNSGFGDDF